MLIKTELTATTKVTHKGIEYAVVNGYADVPQDVADHFTKFSEWVPVTDPLDKKVQAALEKTKPTEQTDPTPEKKDSDQNPPTTPPQNDGTDGTGNPTTPVV